MRNRPRRRSPIVRVGLLGANLDLVALVDLEGHRVGRIDLLLAVEPVDGRVACASGRARVAAKVGAEVGRGVRRPLVRVAGKGLEVEEAAQERPDVGEVGRDECRGRLADVPKGPVGAEGVVEAIVLVEDGG